MSLPASLQYLAARLAQIDGEKIAAATELVNKARASVAIFEKSARAEHALWHSLWGFISQALDHNEFAPVHADAVDALEAELAGRTLTIRMSLGWIARSQVGPSEFPSLEQFIN